MPEGSAVLHEDDPEMNEIQFSVDGSEPASIKVLVAGFPHDGELEVTVGKVAAEATETGRTLVEKGALSGGAYAISRSTPPLPEGASSVHMVIVTLVGRKNYVNASCMGPDADLARMKEVCLTVRATR